MANYSDDLVDCDTVLKNEGWTFAYNFLTCHLKKLFIWKITYSQTLCVLFILWYPLGQWKWSRWSDLWI